MGLQNNAIPVNLGQDTIVVPKAGVFIAQKTVMDIQVEVKKPLLTAGKVVLSALKGAYGSYFNALWPVLPVQGDLNTGLSTDPSVVLSNAQATADNWGTDAGALVSSFRQMAQCAAALDPTYTPDAEINTITINDDGTITLS